ncbi:MAG TPA: excinuclease ABC subunit UvrC, partial [Candidatus Deferrimicrobium sp.]|nr:excinuclease ABC subunit UvrC [Candidatus Deferrimicrobium sp.]
MLKNNKDIPGKPGVYFFKSGKKFLYIGKAKNLKKRISQYFQGRDHLVVGNLLEQADDVEFIVTKNEIDALHLEYNFIHTYLPPFNVRLKDDKTFPLIEISLVDPYPGIYYTRQVKPKNFYVGPITDAKKTRTLIDIITRIFKIRACSEAVFKRGVPCLYFYIEHCTAPCAAKISLEAYNQNVSDAVELLKGKRKKVLDKLAVKMNRLSENLEFEAAQKVKEDIELLERFVLDSYITTVKKYDYDVLALYYHPEETVNDCFIILFSVIGGRVKRKEFFNFNTISPNKEEALKDFLISFYRTENIPPEIIVRFYPPDKESIEQLFSQLAGHGVSVKIPLKGDKRKMADLAAANLSLYVSKTNYQVIGQKLQRDLGLKRFPYWIEGYDISHFSERERVGAKVAFTRGKPDRAKYRNYIIRGALPGDTEALKEVLERRFRKMEEFPDLLLIDGGKGQLSAALEVKQKLGFPSDVAALAKEEERVFMEDGG